MSIERARELLGDEAVGRSNEEVAAIVEHAKQMVSLLIDIYLDRRLRDALDKRAAGDEPST